MSTRAKRPTLKELRQPDEFVTATTRVVEWARQNPRTVRLAAAGLVGVLVLVSVASLWLSSRSARANREFYGAIELYKAEQWQEAFEGFQALAEELGGTAYGRLGALYAARTALKLGKPAEAVRFYRQFLEGSPPVALEQLARLNLARALTRQGEPEAARVELEKALELAGPARPEVLIELAELTEEAGQKDRAIELYTRYLEDHPEAPAHALARARIVALGGTPPASESAGFAGGRNPLQLRLE